jgi:hypothetical protein
MANELIFIVEDALEGGFIARSLDEEIFTGADTLRELKTKVTHAVQKHYAGQNVPEDVVLVRVKDT